jgi:hypothetical protein
MKKSANAVALAEEGETKKKQRSSSIVSAKANQDHRPAVPRLGGHRMKEHFIKIRPQAATLVVIEQANAIIEEYASQDFKLTLRQLYYQFVARDLLEENTLEQYKRIGRIVGTGRDAGLIDWDAIEDRTREVHTHTFWDSPSGIISAAAKQYREDLWKTQPYRPEVWIEKDALLGVIEGVCTELRVPYFAHRGNNSQTLQYQAGKRFAEFLDQGLNPLVLHLADHDPNGIDMTRDNRERLKLYARHDVEVRRIALNLDQVRQYSPPPNFAKETDKRFAAYEKQFRTNKCWELDALSPTVIADLIRTEMEALIDTTKWNAATAKQRRGRKQIEAVAANWTKVKKLLALRGETQ